MFPKKKLIAVWLPCTANVAFHWVQRRIGANGGKNDVEVTKMILNLAKAIVQLPPMQLHRLIRQGRTVIEELAEEMELLRFRITEITAQGN